MTGKTYRMRTATLSSKGQLVIPNHFRKALHLQPGDKLKISLEGEKLVLKRGTPKRAQLIEKHGRKVLVARLGAPAMTPETVKLLLSDFP